MKTLLLLGMCWAAAACGTGGHVVSRRSLGERTVAVGPCASSGKVAVHAGVTSLGQLWVDALQWCRQRHQRVRSEEVREVPDNHTAAAGAATFWLGGGVAVLGGLAAIGDGLSQIGCEDGCSDDGGSGGTVFALGGVAALTGAAVYLGSMAVDHERTRQRTSSLGFSDDSGWLPVTTPLLARLPWGQAVSAYPGPDGRARFELPLERLAQQDDSAARALLAQPWTIVVGSAQVTWQPRPADLERLLANRSRPVSSR